MESPDITKQSQNGRLWQTGFGIDMNKSYYASEIYATKNNNKCSRLLHNRD